MSGIENADNMYLQPFAGCGFVEEVNGPGAREVPEFTPTKAELLVLVKHWQKTFLDSELFIFLTKTIGSTDMRLSPFAQRRVFRIISLLEDDAIKAVREVNNEFCEKLGARDWEEFCGYIGVSGWPEYM